VWLALAKGPTDAGAVEHVLQGIEALGQFADELRRRLTDDGVDGLDGTVDLYLKLRGTVDRIPGAEVARILAQIRALEAWLGEVRRGLSELARLKRLVGA